MNTILIIDDDLSQLDLVEIMLESSGFDVFKSHSGEIALDLLRTAQVAPGLALVDLMMPRMSGAQTIAGIRALNQSFPIIAFTAADDQDLHQSAIDAGADKVLTKPSKPANLIAEIKALLK